MGTKNFIDTTKSSPEEQIQKVKPKTLVQIFSVDDQKLNELIFPPELALLEGQTLEDELKLHKEKLDKLREELKVFFNIYTHLLKNMDKKQANIVLNNEKVVKKIELILGNDIEPLREAQDNFNMLY